MGLLWRLFAPKPLKKARRTVRGPFCCARTAAPSPCNPGAPVAELITRAKIFMIRVSRCRCCLPLDPLLFGRRAEPPSRSRCWSGPWPAGERVLGPDDPATRRSQGQPRRRLNGIGLTPAPHRAGRNVAHGARAADTRQVMRARHSRLRPS